MADMMFNQMPHASLSHGGETLRVMAACLGACRNEFHSPFAGDTAIAFSADGTPAAIWPVNFIGNASMLAEDIIVHHRTPIATFSSWTEGASALPSISCVGSSGSKMFLTEHPQVNATLAIAEH